MKRYCFADDISFLKDRLDCEVRCRGLIGSERNNGDSEGDDSLALRNGLRWASIDTKSSLPPANPAFRTVGDKATRAA
jgi:hypothetical protein